MAFPQVASVTAFSSGGTGAADHAVSMPATIAENDLLILIAHAHGVSTISNDDGDWTELTETVSDGRSLVSIIKPDSTKAAALAGSTVNISVGGTPTLAAQVIRITAASWSQTLSEVEMGTVATATNDAAPDPSSVTSTGGSADNLFIEWTGYDDDEATVSSFSSNYSNGTTTQANSADANSSTVATARRELASASDDPDAMSLSTNENWHASTIVVRPAASEPAPDVDWQFSRVDLFFPQPRMIGI